MAAQFLEAEVLLIRKIHSSCMFNAFSIILPWNEIL